MSIGHTMRRTTTAGAAVAVSVAMISATGITAGVAGAAPRLASGCAPLMAYVVPGTTETDAQADPSDPKGMLSKVGEQLKAEYGKDIKVVYVPYPASAFDEGKTYKASQHAGVANTAKLMSQCADSDIVLTGYSQGADVAGDVAWHIGHGNGPVPASQVRGVGLLADPKRGTNPVVGVGVEGEGISGERPDGYGELEGRIKWVCDKADLYCNVTSDNPYIKALGGALGSAGPTGEVAPLDGGIAEDGMSDLVSDFSNVDLVGAPSKAKELAQRTENLTSGDANPTAQDIAKISELADSLSGTSNGVAGVKAFADSSGTADKLKKAKNGTPDGQTGTVLEALDGIDLGEAGDSASAITELASSMLGGEAVGAPTGSDGGRGLDGGDGDLTASADAIKELALKGADVCQQLCQLSGLDSSNLSTATSVLGGLEVSTVVDTTMLALSTVMSTDYQGLADNLTKLPAQLAVQDVKGAHATAQQINKQLEPWVLLAAEANDENGAMGMASMMMTTVGSTVPEPQTQLALQGAAIAMQYMAKVDIVGLAYQVGQAQEVAWAIAEGDHAAVGQLVPIGVGLAGIGLGVLTEGGKSDASLLSQGPEANAGGMGDSTGMSDLVSEATGGSGNFMDLMNTVQSGDAGQMIEDGIDAASFLGSSAHTGAYLDKSIVGGLSGVNYLAEYFMAQLGDEDSDTGTSGTSKPKSKDKDRGKSDSSDKSGSDKDGSGSTGMSGKNKDKSGTNNPPRPTGKLPGTGGGFDDSDGKPSMRFPATA